MIDERKKRISFLPFIIHRSSFVAAVRIFFRERSITC